MNFSGCEGSVINWRRYSVTVANMQCSKRVFAYLCQLIKAGVNSITPAARFEVAAHSAKDTVISPDLNGNSRIA